MVTTLGCSGNLCPRILRKIRGDSIGFSVAIQFGGFRFLACLYIPFGVQKRLTSAHLKHLMLPPCCNYFLVAEKAGETRRRHIERLHSRKLLVQVLQGKPGASLSPASKPLRKELATEWLQQGNREFLADFMCLGVSCTHCRSRVRLEETPPQALSFRGAPRYILDSYQQINPGVFNVGGCNGWPYMVDCRRHTHSCRYTL